MVPKELKYSSSQSSSQMNEIDQNIDESEVMLVDYQSNNIKNMVIDNKQTTNKNYKLFVW